MTILDEIAEKTRERVEAQKRSVPEKELRAQVADLIARAKAETKAGNADPLCGGGKAFEEALAKEGMSFICEVKKASPSKGVIAQDFPYLEIAKEYEQAGASAMSILTEPLYFKGSDAYLREIRKQVSIPILRKDFTVDPYMLYQAKEMGANAVLLICALLSKTELSEYLGLASELELAALVETHDEREVEMALSSGARIIGVNNRNLKDFTVDIQNSVRLRELVPRDRLFVSESGMKTREDIARLERGGVNAVLIGETLMRSPDKKKMLDELAGRA